MEKDTEYAKNRQAALKWWRGIEISEREKMAKKHFPEWSFVMVTLSSSKIQRIWEFEKDNY